MLFSSVKNLSVNRKGKNNNSQVPIKVLEYKNLITSSRSNNIHVLFAEFYKMLKLKSRILNSGFGNVSSDLVMLTAKLISDTGLKPNRLVFSDLNTYERLEEVCPRIDAFDCRILANDSSSNSFMVCTYTDVDRIGLFQTYNVADDVWELQYPVYSDASLDESHFNYFYGVKFA